MCEKMRPRECDGRAAGVYITGLTLDRSQENSLIINKRRSPQRI